MNQNPEVRLRAMEPEDLDLLYRIENDVKLWHVSTTNVPYSRFTLHEYIANSTGDIYVDRQVRLMIENAVVGPLQNQLTADTRLSLQGLTTCWLCTFL